MKRHCIAIVALVVLSPMAGQSQELKPIRNFSKSGWQSGERFGDVFAVGDFNGDLNPDLAIGVPRWDAGQEGQHQNAGAVRVHFGPLFKSRDTFSLNKVQVLSQDSAEVKNFASDGDLFGTALTAGDF